MKRKITLILGGLFAVAFGLWASFAPQKGAAPALSESLIAITLLPEGRALPAVSLIDQAGDAVGRDVFAGQWSLVFLGFTHCGDICPVTLAQMGLIKEGVAQPLQLVFVSVDPGRDTPAIIRQYVSNYGPGFQGITGEPDELRVLAGAIGASFDVDEAPNRYVVNHSSALFLIGPDAEFRGVITPPFDVSLITQELETVL